MDEPSAMPDDYSVKLAEAVAAAMEGWTQTELAKATGIPQPRLSSIKNNYRGEQVTLSEAMRIEDAVGLPRGYILGFAGLATPEGAKRGAAAAALVAESVRAKSPRSAAPKRSRRP